MQYRKFGNTGVEISALGFGAMRLPQKKVGDKEVFDHEAGEQLIRKAIDMGVNYIDTAPYYCDKESEIIVGKAIKDRRNDIYLSTKNPIESDSGDDFTKRLETSLGKLKTDYIDFYHFWGISWKTYQEKINVKNGPLEAAYRAKEEGLIRHISFSFHDDAPNMFKLIDTGHFETVLCQYNLLDRSNEEAIAYAVEKGLGTVIMGPVGGGRLGAPSDVIAKMMKEKASSTAEAALRFVLSNENVTCALSGMGSFQMLEENFKVASNDQKLSDNEIAVINAAMEENKKLADLYCTGCNYCMPCPAEVNIPECFKLMNYHRVYNLTEYSKEAYAQIGETPWVKGKRADACIECGQCESKCPQKIRIISQLRETHLALGA